jgi:hypothetical protein
MSNEAPVAPVTRDGPVDTCAQPSIETPPEKPADAPATADGPAATATATATGGAPGSPLAVAATSGAGEPDEPFSDLITRWLADGDRLSDGGALAADGTEPAANAPAGRAFPPSLSWPPALAALRGRVSRFHALVGGAALASALLLWLVRPHAHGGAAPTPAPLPPRAAAAPPPPPPPAAAPSPAPAAPAPAPATTVAASDIASAPAAPAAIADEAPAPVAPATVADEAPAAVSSAPPAAAAPATPPDDDIVAAADAPARPAPAPPAAAPERKARPRKRPAAPARPPTQVEACKIALERESARSAIAACRPVADAAPRSADALVLLARADLLAGRPGETLQLASRAVAVDPRYAEAYLLVGTVHQTAGRRQDARAAYESYLRFAPRGRHAADVRAILAKL